MRAFTTLEGIAAPLDRANVDTDQIIPKQFLRKIERSGFGVHLFHDWRYLDDAGTQVNPEFVLNQSRYKGAVILLARDNFGCGSSREHAPWSLEDYGFRCIIAPSFADIFYNNCFKNGMLPIALKSELIDELFGYVEENPGATIAIDLKTQEIKAGSRVYTFEVDAFRKDCLYKGLDDIGLTLLNESKITEFENKQRNTHPWFYKNN
jgi:3-isopropylmalate/(R)-2-methylmalate dehydratase small subunit